MDVSMYILHFHTINNSNNNYHSIMATNDFKLNPELRMINAINIYKY